MADGLRGQIALVTGGGRGFGRAIAERFAAEGAHVAVMSRSGGELDEVVSAIRAAGGTAIAVTGDVTSAADIDAAVTHIEEQFGPVSLMINNAGIPDPFGPIWEVDADRWWRAQEIHIRAPMLFLQRVVPAMLKNGQGRMICVSAIASRMVAANLSAYCTGKIAQNRVVAQAATELAGTPVKMFAIDPGFVFTKLASQTMTSADAAKYLPGMVERLKAASVNPDNQADLARCAQRCVDLASGRYDALSGGYFELPDDLDAKLAETLAEPVA
jgi:NAD(P)-dependent dehydrogenase (short-subunit alcohol dehydrogenase family)